MQTNADRCGPAHISGSHAHFGVPRTFWGPAHMLRSSAHFWSPVHILGSCAHFAAPRTFWVPRRLQMAGGGGSRGVGPRGDPKTPR